MNISLNEEILLILSCYCVLNHLFLCEALGVLKSGGRRCEQGYFKLSGLCTAERAGGWPKMAQWGEGTTTGQTVREEGVRANTATKMASKGETSGLKQKEDHLRHSSHADDVKVFVDCCELCAKSRV